MEAGIVLLEEDGWGGWIDVSQIEECFEDRTALLTFTERDDWSRDKFQEIESVFPEMFAEHGILRKRTNCMRYNPEYANERLLARYQRDKLSSVEDITSMSKVLLFLALEYAATGVEMLHRQFDLPDPEDRDKIQHQLTICNEIVSKRITCLTSSS